MHSRFLVRALCPIIVLFIASCGANSGSTTVPLSRDLAGQAAPDADAASSKFTEYPTAAGIVPMDITMGPGGDAWFANFQSFDSSNVAGGSITNAGVITTKTVTGLYAGSGAIAAAGGYAFAIATDANHEDESLLVRMDAATEPAQIGDLGVCCGSPVTKMIKGPDGNIWLTVCNESCGSGSAFVESFTKSGTRVAQTLLGDLSQGITYQANGIAAGPDGNIYVTAVYTGPPGSTAPDSSVFKLSTAGVVLKQYPLAAGSGPFGIVAGPDGNLWITENAAGKIAKMTTSGVVTTYALPTRTAGPAMITVGNDGALWFTKTNNGTLGRITTSGTLTSYIIPTPNSKPFGIASPATCTCHVRIWFTEEIGKIGKYAY